MSSQNFNALQIHDGYDSNNSPTTMTFFGGPISFNCYACICLARILNTSLICPLKYLLK
jgi:hypothetical protein